MFSNPVTGLSFGIRDAARASVLCLMVLFPVLAVAQAPSTVFRGRPTIKISESGVGRTVDPIPLGGAVNLECVISQIDDSYYWASRENAQMVRVDAGAFITYIALNGSGNVRVIKPELKASASLMGPTEAQFDYVEHIALGLRTVTYYGTRR